MSEKPSDITNQAAKEADTTLPPTGGRAVQAVDPAQQSLADALQVCFRLLKYAMVLLLIGYLATGVFRVDEQQRAVLLRFGRIVGDPGQQVYGPGWHLGLPYPIGEVVYVAIAPKSLNIDQAFWRGPTAAQKDAAKTEEELEDRGGPLNPLKDGSLLTGDANIVHARFDISYKVGDASAYVRNIGDDAQAERLVRNACEQGVIHAVARTAADDVINGIVNQEVARRRAQATLDEADSGLTIVSFNARSTKMPRDVADAYREVSNAENERANALQGAWRQYSETLNKTASSAYPQLLELIEDYERAIDTNSVEQQRQLEAEMEEALRTLEMPASRGGQQIGGEVAERINDAITYRTQVSENVRAEAETFNILYEQYKAAPQVFVLRRWAEMRQRVLGGEFTEKIFVPTKDLYIVTNADPKIEKAREQARLKEEQDAGGDNQD